MFNLPKHFGTVEQFKRHLTDDVLPPLLDQATDADSGGVGPVVLGLQTLNLATSVFYFTPLSPVLKIFLIARVDSLWTLSWAAVALILRRVGFEAIIPVARKIVNKSFIAKIFLLKM